MGDLGLFGISVPEAYGGSGADFLSCVLAMEEIGKGDAGLATSWGAHTVLCTESVYRNGTEAQRQRYLPGLIEGSKIGALAITEPEAGSDAMSMRTRAEKQGDHWVLNGTKMFITNGPLADLVIVYAKTDPEAGPKGITTFLVEDGFPGFIKGKKLKKMGARSSPTGELIFENCIVPDENILGDLNKGVKVLMSGLDRERIVFSMAPIGGAQAAFELAYRYAGERSSSGRPSSASRPCRRSWLKSPPRCRPPACSPIGRRPGPTGAKMSVRRPPTPSCSVHRLPFGPWAKPWRFLEATASSASFPSSASIGTSRASSSGPGPVRSSA
jgi:isovaleryl-CoA dehydrogenase